MRIHFGGATAQEHPATGVLLEPGINEVSEEAGKELLRIADAAGKDASGRAQFPVRTPSKSEEMAFLAARAERAAALQGVAVAISEEPSPTPAPEAAAQTSAVEAPPPEVAAPGRPKGRG